MVKILCIDDYPDILSLYQDELTEEGYQVILAKDSQEAIRKLEEESPEVLVLEINGTARESIKAIVRFQEEKGPIAVILTTTYSPLCEKYTGSGVEACLLKSSDFTELKKKIREALDRRKKSSRS